MFSFIISTVRTDRVVSSMSEKSKLNANATSFIPSLYQQPVNVTTTNYGQNIQGIGSSLQSLSLSLSLCPPPPVAGRTFDDTKAVTNSPYYNACFQSNQNDMSAGQFDVPSSRKQRSKQKKLQKQQNQKQKQKHRQRQKQKQKQKQKHKQTRNKNAIRTKHTTVQEFTENQTQQMEQSQQLQKDTTTFTSKTNNHQNQNQNPRQRPHGRNTQKSKHKEKHRKPRNTAESDIKADEAAATSVGEKQLSKIVGSSSAIAQASLERLFANPLDDYFVTKARAPAPGAHDHTHQPKSKSRSKSRSKSNGSNSRKSAHELLRAVLENTPQYVRDFVKATLDAPTRDPIASTRVTMSDVKHEMSSKHSAHTQSVDATYSTAPSTERDTFIYLIWSNSTQQAEAHIQSLMENKVAVENSSDAMTASVKSNMHPYFTDQYGRNAIHVSCMRDNLNMLKMLEEYGFSIQIKASNRACAAHFAAAFDAPNCLAYLLSKYATLFSAKDSSGLRPIHVAILYNNTAAVDQLLHDADEAQCMDRHGNTLLHFACRHNQLDIIALLLRRCPRLVDVRNKDRRTPLFDALHNVDIVAMLLRRGAVADAADASGQCPLHECARAGWIDTARLLLSIGCKVNVRSCDADAPTPLHIAAKNNHVELSQLLLENKARIRPRVAPLSEGVSTGHTENTVLHIAVQHNAIHTLEWLFNTDNAQLRCDIISCCQTPNASDMTPLAAAIPLAHCAIVRLLCSFLVSCGEPSLLNYAGINTRYTPLVSALKNGADDIAIVLITSGARLNNQAQNILNDRISEHMEECADLYMKRQPNHLMHDCVSAKGRLVQAGPHKHGAASGLLFALDRATTRPWDSTAAECKHTVSLFSDIVLVCDDQRPEFRVHCFMLAARSPYFEAQLFGAGHTMLSYRDDSIVVRLPGISPDIGSLILRFMYLGSVSRHLDLQVVLQLIEAADQLLMLDLVTVASVVAESYISVANVQQMSEFATRHHATYLAQRCRKFLSRRVGVQHAIAAHQYRHLVEQPDCQCDLFLPHYMSQQRLVSTLSFRIDVPQTDSLLAAAIPAALTNICIDGLATDCQVQCGSWCIGAHRHILAAQSSVFGSIFDQQMNPAENTPATTAIAIADDVEMTEVELLSLDADMLGGHSSYVNTTCCTVTIDDSQYSPDCIATVLLVMYGEPLDIIMCDAKGSTKQHRHTELSLPDGLLNVARIIRQRVLHDEYLFLANVLRFCNEYKCIEFVRAEVELALSRLVTKSNVYELELMASKLGLVVLRLACSRFILKHYLSLNHAPEFNTWMHEYGVAKRKEMRAKLLARFLRQTEEHSSS
jgi:ankyrin repeat protein